MPDPDPRKDLLNTANKLLNYIQAPTIGFYYLGASAYALLILHKPQPVSHKRRRGILVCVLTLLLSYIIEVLYYFGQSVADSTYWAPKPSAIRCLGSILAWGPISLSLGSGTSLQSSSFFGAFILQFALETTTCFMSAISAQMYDPKKNVPLVMNCIRALASLLLLLDGFMILTTKHVEPNTDELIQLVEQHLNGNLGA